MVKSLWLMMIVTIVVIIAIFLYAALYYPVENAPRVAEEVPPEVSEEPASPKEDIVLFTFARTRPSELRQLLLSKNGMADSALLEKNLEEQNYSEVLKALWSEQDRNKRLSWLRAKSSESHSILYFELAVEEIQESPTIKGFEEAIYLLELGKARIDLDAVCVNESSVQTASHELYSVYSNVVADEVKRQPVLVKEIFETPKNQLSEAVISKLLASLKEMQKNLAKLPSPGWLSQHALTKLFSNKDLQLPPAQCMVKRRALLDMMIQENSEQLKILRSWA